MPPKKKAKTAAKTPAATRSTRSRTAAASATAAAKDDEPALELAPTGSKRKRAQPELDLSSSDLELSVISSSKPKAPAKPKAAPKKAPTTKALSKALPKKAAPVKEPAMPKPSKSKGAPATGKENGKPAASVVKKASKTSLKSKAAATPKRVEEFFNRYANKDDEIQAAGLADLCKDMRVSEETAVFYVLLWKCRPETSMTISKAEFVNFMKTERIDSPEKLRARMPQYFSEASPDFNKKSFADFHAWCFQHFKDGDASRNLQLDIGTMLMDAIFDERKFDVDWVPTTEESDVEPGKTPGKFPHLKAFLEYLSQPKPPHNTITKDIYQQFVRFNADVPWSLEGYNAEESSWPLAIDEYIEWRKAKYPLPACGMEDD